MHKITRDVAAYLACLKRYIATGKATAWQDAGMQEAMSVKVDPGSDYSSRNVMVKCKRAL